MSLAGLQDDPHRGTRALILGDQQPADRNAFTVYVASLSLSSRRPAAQVLRVVADILVPSSTPEHLPWGRLRFQHVQALKTRLAERYHFTTANRALTAVRGVLRTAFNLDQLGGDDLMKVMAVKPLRGTRVPKGRAISPEELRRLFEACKSGLPGGARDAALIALIYNGGLRRHEAASLDLSSFDASADTLRVVGKNNRERLVYITNGARRALAAWLAFRGDVPGPLLCPVKKGGEVQLRRMSDQTVFDVVAKLARRAGIPKLTPHDFRRTVIGDLLEHTDLATVARVVGHSNPATSALYDRRPERTRRRAFELLHVPFDG